jgi:hypothetical protein
MSGAGSVAYSQSFSQPMIQGGSLASPLSSANQILDYVEGVTKYVFYTTAPLSGAATPAGGQTVIIRGVPLNLLQSVSLSGNVTWCLKGAAALTVFPYIIGALSWANTSPSSIPPSTAFSEIHMVAQTAAAVIVPVFTGGTPVLKYVINLTVD